MSHVISVHNLSYHHPDGTLLFENLNFSLQKEKIGIVGRNGIGKSTLLKLIAKELQPSGGDIVVNGKVSYLPQNIQAFSNQTVAEILNVTVKLNALQKAEQGSATIDDFNIIGDDWDLLNEIEMILNQFHLEFITLTRLGSSLLSSPLNSLDKAFSMRDNQLRSSFYAEKEDLYPRI